jgi:thiol-disulfide isomerase/thioredoxin
MKRPPTLCFILVAAVGILTPWLYPSHAATAGNQAPEITNNTWVNSQPLRLMDLKGNVVLVEFWTFGCYNCQNVEPHVKSWHDKFKDRGLVVIGVHSPEFGYERAPPPVRAYVREHNIRYTVTIDNDYFESDRGSRE